MRKAIEGGQSIRPAMWSLESLAQRRADIGSLIFDQEFMHIPLSKEDALIKLEWCKRWTVLPKFDRTILSIDQATKENEKNDYTGIIFGGIAGGKFYVLRSKQIKLSPHKLEKYVDGLILNLKPDFVLKENNTEV